MPGVELEAYFPGEADGDVEASDDERSELPPVPDVPAYFGEQLREAIESGVIDEAVIDEKIERLLTLLTSVGHFDEADGA